LGCSRVGLDDLDKALRESRKFHVKETVWFLTRVMDSIWIRFRVIDLSFPFFYMVKCFFNILFFLSIKCLLFNLVCI
jgi:hypothetical protein